MTEHQDYHHSSDIMGEKGDLVMTKLIYLLLSLALMAGCMHKPSAHDMADAEYGEVPRFYKEMIIDKINKNLNDPESARIDVPRPYPAIRSLGISKGGKYEYGHVVYVRVSTKMGKGSMSQQLPGSTGGTIPVGPRNSHL